MTIVKFILKYLLYCLTDLIFILVYFILGYRKKIVHKNLNIAFPHYSQKIRNKIARKFYRNFTDLIAEIFIMALSNKQDLQKMIKRNFEVLQHSIDDGKNIIFLSGHIINWELMGVIIAVPPFRPHNLGFYLPLKNKIANNFIYNMRTKFGGSLINIYKFSREVLKFKNEKLTLGFLADQRPFNPDKSYWVNFFGLETPFVKEPEKCAKLFNADVYFFGLKKVGRGRYEAKGEQIIFDHHKEGDMVKQFAQKLEQSIINNPDLYLWSHNRWKFSKKKKV